MSRIVRAGLARAFVLGAATGLAAGCGSGGGNLAPAEAKAEVNQFALNELAEMIRFVGEEKHKAPEQLADFSKYQIGMSTGYEKVKNGEYVVVWGAPIDPAAADKVIAYEKETPESGGYVLMQDGKTVKKMTADEFKAAPKAPGKVAAPAKK